VNITFVPIMVPVGLFALYLLIRNHQVYKLRTRVKREEESWMETRGASPKDMYTLRRYRYEALPEYSVMVFLFWKPVSGFEKGLKSLEYYHPELLAKTREPK